MAECGLNEHGEYGERGPGPTATNGNTTAEDRTSAAGLGVGIPAHARPAAHTEHYGVALVSACRARIPHVVVRSRMRGG
jgi:hypothetical protein